jgi:hypothetical protein
VNRPYREEILMKTIVRLVAAAASFAALGSAHAACQSWDVRGSWYAVQDNGYNVRFDLEGTRQQLAGTSSYSTRPQSGRVWLVIPVQSFTGLVEGGVTGTVRGNTVEIAMADGSGVYVGTIDDTGRIDGHTFDKRNSNSRANWHSDRRMRCATNEPTPQSNALDGGASGGKRASSVFGERPAVPPPVPARPLIRLKCVPGYVWRLASDADRVCVTRAAHALALDENAKAASRRAPRERGGNRYTCQVGFVWREAFVGDLVCVTPARRDAVALENALGANYLPRR